MLPRLLSTLPLLLCLATFAFSQATSTTEPQEPPPIADNSFLIEEAYNQEADVVQHINTFTRKSNGEWTYSFTQEWPAGSQKHQLSLTLPAQSIKGVNSGGAQIVARGIGDVALNYRYQLVSGTKTAIAPRLSLVLPTGDERKQLGAGGFGLQFNLPISVALSRDFVAHSNAGVTFTPGARNSRREKARTVGYNLGQSIVWLAAPRFNVLVEAVWVNSESVVGTRRKIREHEFLINPGIRWAHNFRNGLQIVPGIAGPVGPSRGERGVFFYLSFEHPFKRT